MHTQLNTRPSKPVTPLRYRHSRMLVVVCRHEVDCDTGELLDVTVTASYPEYFELRTDRELLAPCLPVGIHADERTRVFLFGELRAQQGDFVDGGGFELFADDSLAKNVYTQHFSSLLWREPTGYLDVIKLYCRNSYKKHPAIA